jgi:glucoamylase
MKRPFQFLPLIVLLFACPLFAQSIAPGGPGKDAQWATAAKQSVGTSATTDSKIWFTLAQGVMTEVYYPDVTTANVHLLQFVVVDPKTKTVETEQDDASSQIKTISTDWSNETSLHSIIKINKYYHSPNSMVFEQTTTSRSQVWSIDKTFFTDPANNSVIFSVNFRSTDSALELYVYYDPSLANSGMHDTGWFEGRTFLSSDGPVASALTCGRCKLSDMTSGFLGTSDGLTQLRANGKIAQPYSRAENGNLVQVAKVTPVALERGIPEMVFVLGFGNTPETAAASAQNTLAKGYEKTYREYQKGWLEYLRSLPKVDTQYQAQFNMAAMQLKAHEDKTHAGANIASLSVPWGGGATANENTVGGYHLVWSRDLYQVATAYMALGDTAAANRALGFVFNVQQKPDGSFPQNSMLDGKPFWASVQLDEVAFPLILAYQLGRYDKKLYQDHIKKAADFIVKNGPSTPQERWEEESGYSPSTIAAEIAGLVCAAEIARKNGDQKSADLWLATADDWQSNVEKWTATSTGKYGDGYYYLRITQNGRPDAGDKIELNNGAGVFDEREIVDAGFLELVRLGIKPASDPLIEKSVSIIDRLIKVDTPNGPAFYRYNFDGYGEMNDGRRWNWDGKYTGKGRLWALLSGERGEYALARAAECDHGPTARTDRGRGIPILTAQQNKCLAERSITLREARSRLDHMLAFANEGLMIPEQIWDKKEVPAKIDRQFISELKFGEGTGSATPLAWSMAQFIRLALNLKAGRNLETPEVVYRRYNK